MSAALKSRAEILKLARLLQRDPGELAYLKDVAREDLQRLREQVTDVLFDAHGQRLARLAAASRLLPIGVVATIGERAFGPMLSARVTGLLEPMRAVEMAAKLLVEFLADIAVELDPRRASEVISRISPVHDITRVLMRRGEYVTMARFVGYLDTAAISAAVVVMDDRSLLQVALILEPGDGLHDLIGLLAPQRLDGIVAAAVAEDLWPEVVELVSQLTDERASRLLDAANRPAAPAAGGRVGCRST